MKFGIIDEIVRESDTWEIEGEDENGETHTGAFEKTANELKRAIVRNVKELSAISASDLVKKRYERFRRIGSAL
jgi:acetyl-CoA carboxylase alpha subunit